MDSSTLTAAVENTPLEEIDRKFQRAREAFEIWRKYPISERVRLLKKVWEQDLKTQGRFDPGDSSGNGKTPG